MTESGKILVAGGTGLIGKKLVHKLRSSGYSVIVLTRNMSLSKQDGFKWWNLDTDQIAEDALDGVSTIINLCGAGIADKRWTDSRKKELRDSRIKPTKLLLSAAQRSGKIEHYISASGINCYPINTERVVHENHAYGSDYLSTLVQEWESAALKFEALCPVTLLRISAVLTEDGGALAKMKPLFKFGAGAPLGTGRQPFTWVHEDDLIHAVIHLMKNKLSGPFNICGETVSNHEFSMIFAQSLKRWMLPIGVPAFAMKLMLGEMSEMLLNGVNTDAQKLVDSGFKFEYPKLEQALQQICK